MESAVESDFKSDSTRASLARVWALRKLGTAMAARMPMMATTINNSIKVNALFFIFLSLEYPKNFHAIEAKDRQIFSGKIIQ